VLAQHEQAAPGRRIYQGRKQRTASLGDVGKRSETPVSLRKDSV
jgi:hypothetical protein